MGDIGSLFKDAEIKTQAGDVVGAIQVYEKILRTSGENAEVEYLAHLGIGDIELNRKNLDAAEIHLKEAIRLKPDSADSQYLLGCCFTYSDDFPQAIKYLKRALELKPDNDVILGQLGWVVGYKIDEKKGIVYLKKSLSINPTNAGSLRDLCMLYTRNQRWGEALVCIEEAQKHSPNDQLIERLRKDVEFFRSEHTRLIRKGTS